jgi:hypothetical protein
MTDSERTDWDEAVDEAIEVLISEDTSSFVLAGVEGDDVHSVSAVSSMDERLLAVFIVVEEVRMLFEDRGVDMDPFEVVMAAGYMAERAGCLDGEVTRYRTNQ